MPSGVSSGERDVLSEFAPVSVALPDNVKGFMRVEDSSSASDPILAFALKGLVGPKPVNNFVYALLGEVRDAVNMLRLGSVG